MLIILNKLSKFKAVCQCQQCGNSYVTHIYDAKKSFCGDICNNCKYILINATELTQSLLKKVFNYNSLTGIVTYKVKTLRSNIGDTVGHKQNGGYLEVRINKNIRILLHRLIFLYQTGYLPNKIDHINHIRTDNRWSNLRAVDNTAHARNCSISKNSVTKINGVNYIKKLNKYRAYITVNRKCKHLGVFTNIDDAIYARKRADIQYNFHPNHGK